MLSRRLLVCTGSPRRLPPRQTIAEEDEVPRLVGALDDAGEHPLAAAVTAAARDGSILCRE
ncbi:MULTISPECIES: hypothetical protein [unclassified Streptomyces]|uniref:hypothetical protein n=1 Tax=unclassified Streptomyces TaxID=2593676 RepID=UPI002DDA6A16|nr:hypothetical protein [Streptomyces sp. NBC_01750]WSB04754.1 hypothetical protein OIE54_39255 [Streptomyces sp. NBC_01794]WSD30966.1 hypothetical protein OG966_02850 [Streptomyces sp. NBC_01750]